MAVSSPQAFSPRKRRPIISDLSLLRSLLALSQEISSLTPLRFLLTTNSSSLIRKVTLLNLLFDDLSTSRLFQFPSPALLCFDEMYILLRRIKTLIQDCSAGSITWLLMQIDTIAYSFRELAVDLSTLLDVFPVKDIQLSDDVRDIFHLVRNQCYQTDASLDHTDAKLRRELVRILDGIKREIVPDQSKLSTIFTKLGLTDSSSCRDEMERLEEEFQTQSDDKSRSEIIALIGLVRYAKCVLYGASTPNPPPQSKRHHHRRASSIEINVPADFRCPISLDLMRDPVVVSTGQTYDRVSINVWVQSGHNTCPKTGQTLAHTDLIPNLVLRSLLASWCREQRIPFQLITTEAAESSERVKSLITSKTALEATRMTVSFLVNKLAASRSVEDVNGFVYELRALAKSDSDSRACIAEANGIPLLVRNLGSDHPNLQINAVTTILNMSILEANKIRIVETEGALNGVVEVLRSGATWEAKGNAAAAIFSLCSVHAYRKRLGRKARIVNGLLNLARDGPIGSKRDALVAIMNLAGDRETVCKLIDGGVVSVVVNVMDALPEEALTILEMVVKRGGVSAIAQTYNTIRKLGNVLREGSDHARESAAATLVIICRKGGLDVVAELAGISGIERVIWELMGSGTVRARRKSASLLRILRRWAAGMDGEAEYSTRNVTSTSRILLPS
ncbi:unnamed protein product [Rhodiola kirilowii]